jgi:GntR family transcriptional regulator
VTARTNPPRYQQVADALRSEITAQRLKPGDPLPTEMELCQLEGISRHTAREALRLLAEEGLIQRRRGAGTVVADTPPPTFAQPLGSFDQILQYARDAAFQLEGTQSASRSERMRLGIEGDYVSFHGLRGSTRCPPIAVTTILVERGLAPSAETVSQLTGSISEWIESTHGVAVLRVTQRMEAVSLTKPDAARLNVEAGTPALRTVRRYQDAQGREILISESLHPAGRFAYEIRLDRKRS